MLKYRGNELFDELMKRMFYVEDDMMLINLVDGGVNITWSETLEQRP